MQKSEHHVLVRHLPVADETESFTSPSNLYQVLSELLADVEYFWSILHQMSQYAAACLILSQRYKITYFRDLLQQIAFQFVQQHKNKQFNTRQENSHSVFLCVSRACSAVYNLPYFNRNIYGKLIVARCLHFRHMNTF